MIIQGDAEGCGALGVVLQRAAVGVGTSRRELSAARSATSSWQGPAAEAWRAAEGRQQGAAEDLSAALNAAGTALTSFATALTEAQALAASARSSAAGAGLALSADGWVPEVHVPYGPYATPEQAEQAREAARRAEARADVLRLVAAAREAEREAHDRLLRSLGGVDAPRATVGPGAPVVEGRPSLPRPGWNDWLDLANGLVLAPGAAYSRASAIARARGDFAKSIKSATTSGTLAQRAAARTAWRDAVRSMREAQRAADAHALKNARLQPVSGWLGRASQPLSRTLPVVRSVPGLSVLMAGVGTAVDVNKGMSPTHAGVKNVASTAAGMAAGAAATALFAGGAIAFAPVVAGVVVGAGIGYAVGWAVEEYGDEVADMVGDAAGEAVESVGDVVEGAGEAIGGLWGKITG